MMRFPSKLTLDPDTSAALSSLVDGLTPLDPLLAGLDTIDAADIPPPCHDLLVHSNHMTSTLQNYYSGAMELHVVKDHAAKEDYRRMILLTVEGTTKVVEFGIVRIDLTLTSAEVRAAILARTTPLGEILERHNVLRRVEPLTFLRFQSPSPVLTYFSGQDAYGRIAVIHCDGQPAIELLEVVPGGAGE